MRRNEFLLRLACENKLAIVSEQVAVIQMFNNSESAKSEKSLSSASQSHDVNISVSDTFTFPEFDPIDLDKIVIRSPVTTSSASGISSEHVDDIGVSNPAQECLMSNLECQDTHASISNTLTLSESEPMDLENTGVRESTTSEVVSIGVDFKNLSTSEDGTSQEYLSPNSPIINTQKPIFFQTAISEASTSLGWDKKDSQSNEEDSYTDNFQDFENSGSEYIPSSDPSFSSIDSDLSSDCESDMKGESSKANALSYVKDSQVHKVKQTYSRSNLNLLHSEPKNKSALSVVTNNMEINNKLRSKIAVELGREGNFDSEAYISLAKIPKLTATDETCAMQSITNSDINQKYIKKSAARERPTICPICYEDVVTHFSRHLFRHHANNKNVKVIQSLKPGCKERLALVAALRKQGYFHLKIEKNILNPVRTSKDSETKYFVCTYCLGHYTKNLLYKHVKHCKNKPVDVSRSGRNCLSKSQTFMALTLSKNHEYLMTSRIHKEVFEVMRADDISAAAKNDPLICLYGETLLAKHKRQQIATVVSSRIREMARLLLVLKSMDNDVSGFFDTLRPEMFRSFILATKIISGYNENKKSFKAPSLALHMGTNLKIVCNVAFKIVIEKRKIPKINWDDRDQKKSEIKDLRKLIEGHWCNEISSLALKTLKERQWEKPVQLPLTSDILAFQTYVNELAENAYEKLNNNIDIRTNYKVLTECVLAQTVMFNRKRVGDVQFLKIETYNKDNCGTDQEAFTESLTAVEKLISKKFKRVVTGGKGSKPVAILFPRRIQKFMTCLLTIRGTTNVVPKSNPYMFANPGSEERWMAGANIIRRLATNCGAKQPTLLTSTKFRKHIATTLQLMNMQPDEMEQIATFMGHTKKTHDEFYRLPQDIYQTAKVAKVLLLLEKGKGKEFQGKSLSEIQLEKDIYYSSESDENEDLHDIQPLSERLLCRTTNNITTTSIDSEIPGSVGYVGDNKKPTVQENTEWLEELESGKLESRDLAEKELNVEVEEVKGNEFSIKQSHSKKVSGRIRWTDKEKKMVLNYFRLHLKNKVTPKKHECEQFLVKHGKSLINKDWVRIKTLVYNSFRGT